jgi:hypothetical protein
MLNSVDSLKRYFLKKLQTLTLQSVNFLRSWERWLQEAESAS